MTIHHVRHVFQRKNATSISSSEDAFGLDRILEIKYMATAGMEDIINELLKNANVAYAEPYYLYRIDNTANNFVNKGMYERPQISLY